MNEQKQQWDLPRQKITIDMRITVTEIMAITRAHWDVSGYSKSSQIFRWTSFLGRIRSSSLIKPSSSRNLLKASSPNSKNLISSVKTSKEIRELIDWKLISSTNYRSVHGLDVVIDRLIDNSKEWHRNWVYFYRKNIRFSMDQRIERVDSDCPIKFAGNYSTFAIEFQI